MRPKPCEEIKIIETGASRSIHGLPGFVISSTSAADNYRSCHHFGRQETDARFQCSYFVFRYRWALHVVTQKGITMPPFRMHTPQFFNFQVLSSFHNLSLCSGRFEFSAMPRRGHTSSSELIPRQSQREDSDQSNPLDPTNDPSREGALSSCADQSIVIVLTETSAEDLDCYLSLRFTS
jgi:hypothetical protein